MARPKTFKKPRVGSDNPKSPGSRKVVKKQTKKAERREGKNKKLTEANNIAKMVLAVSQKNYALANKYLKAVIQEKLEKRIASALNQPLF